MIEDEITGDLGGVVGLVGLGVRRLVRLHEDLDTCWVETLVSKGSRVSLVVGLESG